MTLEQFSRLTVLFWKTGTDDEHASSYREYRRALGGIAPHALDAAIDRAIREGDKMPLPAKLRLWAREAAPPMGSSAGMVSCCVCASKGKSTLMPKWTFCPACFPNASREPHPLTIFPQCTLEQAERYLNGETVEHLVPAGYVRESFAPPSPRED